MLQVIEGYFEGELTEVSWEDGELEGDPRVLANLEAMASERTPVFIPGQVDGDELDLGDPWLARAAIYRVLEAPVATVDELPSSRARRPRRHRPRRASRA